jgi:hypothetical protein
VGSHATPDEASPDGSQIFRHPARGREWEPAAAGDPEAVTAIEEHIARYFGAPETVWHELASDLVHIDVHVTPPSPDRPRYTLVTSGMSDLPMNVPPVIDTPYAELMMALPPDWPLTAEAFRDEAAYWPVRLLKTIARLPHAYDTWIGPGHSVPNGDPPKPHAPGVPFTGVLVAPVLRCEDAARTIVTSEGKHISLLALIPVHQAEMNLKLASGASVLYDAFDRAGVSEVLDPARPSSV